jgi:hypothetical protein
VATSVAEQAEAPIPRERGWGKLVLGSLAFLLLPLTPLLRVLLPVERTALLIAPVLAALTVAGWLGGGRAGLAVIWVGVATWSVAQLSGAGLFALLQGGWTLLVAAAFGAAVAIRRDPSVPFFSRAIRAVSISLGIALLVAVVTPNGATRIAEGVAVEAGRRAEESRTGWREMTGTPDWKQFVADNPSAGTMTNMVDAQLTALPTTARMLFPALAALQALAAMALAWALYHRIGRARIGPPLAPVRDFRFNDQMVWGVVGGLAMIVIPGLGFVKAIGANLLLFFGALYTIRGVGVFMWMWSPGRVATAALVVIALLFWNYLGVLAFGLGVGDTWLDWRSRAQKKT